MPDKPVMNSFERYERNAKIVALRARGLTELSIATKFEMSIWQVRRIMEEWRSTNPTLRVVDPLAIIDDMLRGYQADLEQLGEVAEHADSSNAVVGAINSRMAARDRIIALLQTTGVLPHDLGKLRVELDVRYIAQKLVTVMGAHGVGEDVQRELMEALYSGDVPPVDG